MMAARQGRVIESAVLQTALGIRFWDAALNRPVNGGLMVKAQRLNADGSRRVGRPVTARPNLSGVYVFSGLHPDERSALDPLPPHRALVNVTDPLKRYLPAAFVVNIPFRGVFKGRGGWLVRPLMLPTPAPGSEPGVYLFSAPNRAIPAGWTAVYATIVVGESASPPPAAWAVLRVSTQGPSSISWGMADQDGRLMLPLPYPALPQPVNDDPLPPLREQVFRLQAEVLYEPAQQVTRRGSPAPDLDRLLGQARRMVAEEHNLSNNVFTYVNWLTFSLRFEEQPVLRTTITGQPRGESVLRVQGG
jgi:hypothetical protein